MALHSFSHVSLFFLFSSVFLSLLFRIFLYLFFPYLCTFLLCLAGCFLLLIFQFYKGRSEGSFLRWTNIESGHSLSWTNTLSGQSGQTLKVEEHWIRQSGQTLKVDKHCIGQTLKVDKHWKWTDCRHWKWMNFELDQLWLTSVSSLLRLTVL